MNSNYTLQYNKDKRQGLKIALSFNKSGEFSTKINYYFLFGILNISLKVKLDYIIILSEKSG